MVRHQKTLLRTDRLPETPWEVGCTCGWKMSVVDEKAGTKLHQEHRKASKPTYRLSRRMGRGILFVQVVPPINGDWGYTLNANEAAVVDDKVRTRFLRHMKTVGAKGFAQLVIPP